MAIERVTERSDGTRRERVVERDEPSYVDRGAPGAVGVVVGVAILALVAIIAFFMLSRQPSDNLQAGALSGAAATVTDTASKSVGDTASRATQETARQPTR